MALSKLPAFPKTLQKYATVVRSKSPSITLLTYTFFLAVFLNLTAGGFLFAAEATLQFYTLPTIITGLSRESSDSPLLITTSTGTFFSQTAKPIRTKNGDAVLTINGDGRLEALLLSHVNRPVTLIISRSVDGLVIGATFENGLSHFETLSVRVN